MKKFCLCLVTLVVILFIGFSTYYIIRNDEDISYTVSENDTIYLNLGEKITSPIIHTRRAAGSKVEVTLSNTNVAYDEQNETFTAVSAGSTTVTAVPSNTKFVGISFTIAVGDGTSVNPFYIRTEDDFASIGSGQYALSANYEVVADITFTKDLKPIGSEKNPFDGTLFGGETMYTISNINIASDGQVAGIFAATSQNASIERLNFDGVTLNGEYDYAGALAGINAGFVGQCTFKNLHLTNTSTIGRTGSIAGQNINNGSNGRISLCTVEGAIYADNIVGGFVGENKGGVIDNCISQVEVDLQSNQAIYGGLAGANTFGTVKVDTQTRCLNAKFINVLAGLKQTGDLGHYYTLIGKTFAAKYQAGSWTYFNMTLAQAHPAIEPIGQIIDDNKVTEHGNAAVGHYNNISAAEREDKNTYTAPVGSTWSFGDFWALKDGRFYIDYNTCAGSYPELPWDSTIKMEITTAEQAKNALALMRDYPNANLEYVVKQKITLDYQGATLSPIGTEDFPFVGKIVTDKYTDEDGIERNYAFTIINYKIESDEEYVGFFGAISGKDTIISGIKFIHGTYSGEVVGGIVGLNLGATIENCAVNSLNIETHSIAGGMIGVNEGTLKGADDNETDNVAGATINLVKPSDNQVQIGAAVGVNLGTVSHIVTLTSGINIIDGTDQTIMLGGLVGYQGKGAVKDSFSSSVTLNGGAAIEGFAYAGGLVGYLDEGEIGSSYMTAFEGKLPSTGSTYGGGIAGFVGGNALVEACISNDGSFAARVAGGIAGILYGKIDRCAVEVGVVINGDMVAGLVGECYGSLTNAYSFASLSATSIEAGFVGTVNNGAVVQFCYNYCAYNGTSSKAYCETSTPFRSQKGGWTFLNNVVIGYKVGDGGLLGDTFVTQIWQRGYSTKVWREVEQKDANGNPIYEELRDENGAIVYEELKDEEGNVVYQVQTTEAGEIIYEELKDEDGNIVYQVQTDENGEIVYQVKTDENGEIVYQVKKDENGEIVYQKGGDGQNLLDESGNPIPELATDENGNHIPELATDEEGNFIPELVKDEQGNPVPELAKDEQGNPIPKYVLDAEGNKVPEHVKDENGNLVPVLATDANGNHIVKKTSQQFTELNPNTKKAEIQNKNRNKGTFVSVKEEELSGFGVFVDCGFNSAIWNIYGSAGAGSDGFLTLMNMPIIPDGTETDVENNF